MLVRISVGNFLSFKDSQTLSLELGPFKEMPENTLIPYLFSMDYRLLKSVAIYGHNSFGKTNFIKAFKFLHTLIYNSFSQGQMTSDINIEPFRLNTDMVNKDSEFEIVFIVRETKYRYLIKLNRSIITFEGLYYAESKIRENWLFEREFQKFRISKSWNKEASNIPEHSILFTKKHILFLSVLLSQETVPRIENIGKWFNSNVIIPDNYLDNFGTARKVYSDLHYRDLILKFIDKADIGFKTIFDTVDKTRASSGFEKGFLSMWFDKEIQNFELFTNHIIYNAKDEPAGTVDFELQKNESAGSIKYFIIVCFLAHAIRNNQIVWIDELDARFDSLLLEMLVKSFHDPELNPANAQMIFTTHNTILLDNNLRRDQMFSVTKDKFGASHLSLMHSSETPIRVGRSVEKEYRKGRLGGTSKKVKKDLGPTLFDGLDDDDE